MRSGLALAGRYSTLAPGIGFPGTEGGFNGSADLVSPNTLVFVVDSDGDLSTHETFPAGFQIVVRPRSDTPI